MARSKAYLFSGVEIRWKSAIADGDTPDGGHLPLPRRPRRLPRRNAGASHHLRRPPLRRKSLVRGQIRRVPGSVEWAINWTPAQDGFIQSYCNTVPTPEGGTHEAGFWAAILKGIRAYGERAKNRKAEQITREDLAGRRLRARLRLHPRPRIRRPDQGPPLHRRSRPHDSKAPSATISTTGLAATRNPPGAILDFLVLRAEERLRRRQEKETQRKTATKKLRLPGKLTDCSANTREGTELFIVEGDSRRRLRQEARAPRNPGPPAAQGQDPERPRRRLRPS